MADTKISGMVAATALTGAEVLPVVQSAANVKATTQQVVDAAMTTGLTRQALGSINTDTTIDWSAGSYVTATIAGALTFTFSNPAPTGKACVAYLQLTDGGSAVITWPVSVTWSGGTAPTLRASGVDLLRFYTQDNGTTWFGTAEIDEQQFAASAITSGTIDTARLGSGTANSTTFLRGDQTWSAVSASPGGSDTQVQFNDGGAFGGDSGLTYNKTTDTLTSKIFQAQRVNNAPLLQTGTTSSDACLIWVTGNELQAARGDIGALISFQASIVKASAQFQSGSYAMGVYNSGLAFGNTNFSAFANVTCHSVFVCGATGGYDTALTRDAAGTLAQRDGTNAQTFRVYNTYTDASNYERGKFEWASNELRIGTEKAGTGSARGLALQVDGANVVSWNAGTLQATFAYQTNHSSHMNFSGLGQLYSHRNRVSALTNTSYTFTTADCGGTILIATNASDQNFTTPASPGSGTHIGFKVSTSKSSYLRITANTGQKIRLAGGLSASAGYVRSNVAGSFVWLIYDDTDAEWVAWQQGGTWTIDS